MTPEAAHCHLGLGKLYWRTGKREQAREHPTTATTMYREMGTEGGRIQVRAEPRDGAVEVSVTDTGVGIAPEDQEAVFEEFRQVGTADKKVEGTGLGLTLCRKFVELHGGKIWVKSELGQGSTFTFTIPVSRGE